MRKAKFIKSKENNFYIKGRGLPSGCKQCLQGQKAVILVDGYKEAGYHSVTWNASTLSSGIYFYKLTTGEKVFTKRMTLLK